MKLFAVLTFFLVLGQVFCEPSLLGGIFGTAGGLVGTILGGGGSSSQQVNTRRVQAAAPAPAATPTINVNVQNVYNKQNNKKINNNNAIGSVNNNVVNNDVRVKQDINNKAISNEYNNEEINNRQVNNQYGGGYAAAPAQQPREEYREAAPAPAYTGEYENERQQSYKSRDAIQAEREREYSEQARSRGNYQSY